MMSNKRQLGFTIQGEFINDLAIERCFMEGEIPAAIELLTSCLVTDELSDGDRLALAIDILDGKVLMKGVYPGDYHLEETTPKKPERTVANKIKDMVQQLKDQKAEIRKYQQQITAVAEYLSGSWKGERELGLINAYWQREYDDTSRIWELGQAAEESRTGADILLKAITGSDDPVQEFLDRQRRPNLDEDYGWLAPDGTFHAVKFGEHRVGHVYFAESISRSSKRASRKGRNVLSLRATGCKTGAGFCCTIQAWAWRGRLALMSDGSPRRSGTSSMATISTGAVRIWRSSIFSTSRTQK